MRGAHLRGGHEGRGAGRGGHRAARHLRECAPRRARTRPARRLTAPGGCRRSHRDRRLRGAAAQQRSAGGGARAPAHRPHCPPPSGCESAQPLGELLAKPSSLQQQQRFQVGTGSGYRLGSHPPLETAAAETSDRGKMSNSAAVRVASGRGLGAAPQSCEPCVHQLMLVVWWLFTAARRTGTLAGRHLHCLPLEDCSFARAAVRIIKHDAREGFMARRRQRSVLRISARAVATVAAK